MLTKAIKDIVTELVKQNVVINKKLQILSVQTL